jgi:anti-sigma factor RsiW
MRCDEISALLDDYTDGALAADVSAAIDDHLAGCPGCAGELATLRRLLGLAAGLPHEIEPPRDLWPEVAGRLGAQQNVVRGWFGGRWQRPLAAAAAAVVAVGALLIAYSVGRQHGSPRVVLAPTASPLAVPAGLANTTFAGAEAEFSQARDALLAALEARRGSMSQDTLRVVDENLRLIDQAIERISIALVDDPLNPRLTNQLAAAYRRQIELLQRATGLPAEA